ncbi:MAG TPA: DUF6159 family protein [Acidimicrobiia bacterium]
MNRISATIEIAKSSLRVLKADKELVVLPLLSGLASITIVATFFVPLRTLAIADSADSVSTGGYVMLFLLYVVLSYITIFFNAALVCATHERLNGGDPTVGSALRGAASKAGKILPWALVSATVSLILRAIEERSGVVGRIVIGFIGMAWSVVTFLVLPIIVIEGIGVGDAVKRSTNLFRRTWGENLAAQVGFGLLGFAAMIPGLLLFGLGASSGSIALLVLGIVWAVAVSLVLATLSGIFQTALYHYAADGSVPGGFYAPQVFSAAFAPRGGWRGN